MNTIFAIIGNAIAISHLVLLALFIGFAGYFFWVTRPEKRKTNAAVNLLRRKGWWV